MHANHAAPKLVLFDLDGTLADTFKDLFWALNQALGEFGHGHADARAIRMRVSHGARAMSRAALADDAPDLDAVVQRFLAIYEQHVATRTTLFEGIEQVLIPYRPAEPNQRKNRKVADERERVSELREVYGGGSPRCNRVRELRHPGVRCAIWW